MASAEMGGRPGGVFGAWIAGWSISVILLLAEEIRDFMHCTCDCEIQGRVPAFCTRDHVSLTLEAG